MSGNNRSSSLAGAEGAGAGGECTGAYCRGRCLVDPTLELTGVGVLRGMPEWSLWAAELFVGGPFIPVTAGGLGALRAEAKDWSSVAAGKGVGTLR